jgi:hypothetical protein
LCAGRTQGEAVGAGRHALVEHTVGPGVRIGLILLRPLLRPMLCTKIMT